MTALGPFETSRDALLAAPRPQEGENLTDANLRALTAALADAGVTLSAYEQETARWLANWEGETVAIIVRWIQCVHENERS